MSIILMLIVHLFVASPWIMVEKQNHWTPQLSTFFFINLLFMLLSDNNVS